MAISTIATTVGTTAVQIIPQEAYAVPGFVATVVSNNGANPVFIGPSTVTASGTNQGVQIAAGANLPLPTLNSPLYAVAATGSNAVSVGLFS